MSAGPDSTRVAALHYVYGNVSTFAEYAAKVKALAGNALERGAKVLLFPEYGSLELILAAGEADAPLGGQLAAMEPFLPDFLALFAGIAREGKALVVAPTFPVYAGNSFVNTAHVFCMENGPHVQEKLILTDYERATSVIAAGRGQSCFDTPFGDVGVLVCFDAEFPSPAAKLAQAGAELLLVPSNTDSVAGVSRVRVGAAARALENQCYVVTSTTGGEAGWCGLIDLNHGGPAIFCPPDIAMEESGVVATAGGGDESSWLVADLDLGALREVRRGGEVSIPRHSWEQPVKPAERVSLR